jgi:acetylornithine deacetylase/succinyl-diaminopimelate desuccinylase-like protein
MGMADRRDALRAAAHFILAIAGLPEHLAGIDPFATATVGALTVAPNSPNVIAGQVRAITDLRSSNAAGLARLAGMAHHAAEAAAVSTSVAVTVDPVLDQAPVTFDAQVREVLAAVLTRVQGAAPALPSLAGHDAAHLQSLAPAGMLFVRCTGGISHRADEAVTAEDAAQAAQALLDAVLALDAQLLVQCSL